MARRLSLSLAYGFQLIISAQLTKEIMIATTICEAATREKQVSKEEVLKKTQREIGRDEVRHGSIGTSVIKNSWLTLTSEDKDKQASLAKAPHTVKDLCDERSESHGMLCHQR